MEGILNTVGGYKFTENVDVEIDEEDTLYSVFALEDMLVVERIRFWAKEARVCLVFVHMHEYAWFWIIMDKKIIVSCKQASDSDIRKRYYLHEYYGCNHSICLDISERDHLTHHSWHAANTLDILARDQMTHHSWHVANTLDI